MLDVGGIHFFPSAGSEEIGDCAVVFGSVGKSLLHQLETGVKAKRSFVIGKFIDDIAVVERIGNRRYTQIVLGRSANHARPADVDIGASHLGSYAILGDRLAERIEIHHDHIDGIGLKALEIALMRFIVSL